MMKPLDNFGRRTCMQTVNFVPRRFVPRGTECVGYHIVRPYASSQHGPRRLHSSIHPGTSNYVNLLCEFAAFRFPLLRTDCSFLSSFPSTAPITQLCRSRRSSTG